MLDTSLITYGNRKIASIGKLIAASLLFAGVVAEASGCCVTIIIPSTTSSNGRELYGNISIDENFNASNPMSIKSATLYYKDPGPTQWQVVHAPPSLIKNYNDGSAPKIGDSRFYREVSFAILSDPVFSFTMKINSSYWLPNGWEVWKTLSYHTGEYFPVEVSFTLPGSLPSTVVTSAVAVPEPEAYAMMSVGLFVLCAFARRKKQA